MYEVENQNKLQNIEQGDKIHLKEKEFIITYSNSSDISIEYQRQQQQHQRNRIDMLDTIIIGFSWFLTSAVLSTYANQAFLIHFAPRADVLTAIRFIGSALIGILSGSLFTSRSNSNTSSAATSIDIFKSFFFPALFLLLANLFNSLSLSISGITLTYITKAAIPVITAFYCVVFLKAKYSIMVYFSLFVTCFGVALSCYSDMDFKPSGLAAALLSTFFQVAMNITSKQAFSKHINISGIQGQCYMAIIASSLIIPLLTIKDFIFIYFSSYVGDNVGNKHENVEYWWSSVSSTLTLNDMEMVTHLPKGNFRLWIEKNKLLLLLITALAYHLEYVLNFLFVSRVGNLSFSLADISRRLGIVVSGTILFNKTLTTVNWIGIFIAMSGVLTYSLLSMSATSSKNSSSSSSSKSAEKQMDSNNSTNSMKKD